MRLAVVSDIHGNSLAFEAVLADMKRVGFDLAVDLGDCVSGPLWPRETIEMLEELGWPTVRGNHDRLVAELDVAALGHSDRYAAGRLSQAQRDRLGRLPFELAIMPGVSAFHATPQHDDRYTVDAIADGRLMRAPLDTIRRRLGPTAARIILHGHSHRQEVIALPDGPLLINPGSVGCPAYEDATGQAHVSESGSPHARYALVDLTDSSAEVSFRFVAYDNEAAARQAEANGRSEWAHALRTGFMPKSSA
jgi:predicted phosphodiesterase